MENYTYKNNLISKRQLKEILGWCFLKYSVMQSCTLADELKNVGFKYASKAGISISIEDLRVPYNKNFMLKLANYDLRNAEKVYLKGKITNVERFQKIIDTWDLTSEILKTQIIEYFKNYDPLNSVYIMASSGARGNFSQVRQLIGMRGLMSSPSGQVLNLAIKKNFREGLSITDYLISGYGARKGIVDTALKTANSGYLTRRLIDVAQDIIIRAIDCFTNHSFYISPKNFQKTSSEKLLYTLMGRTLMKSGVNLNKTSIISKELIKNLKKKNSKNLYIRSPLTCKLYRGICQTCYGLDLATQNIVNMGEAIGILAGQSIGEPGTQLTMRTFHTGGVFQSRIRRQIFSPITCIVKFSKFLKLRNVRTNRGEEVGITQNSGYIILVPKIKTESLVKFPAQQNMILFLKNNQYLKKGSLIGEIIDKNRQFKSDMKPIVCYNSGEVVIPFIRNKFNTFNQNQLFWLLAGQVYTSPPNSFINFYADCKLNRSSFVFRTKIINHYPGLIKSTNFKKNLLRQQIEIISYFGYFKKSQFRKLAQKNNISNAILSSKDINYLVSINFSNQKVSLKKTRENQIAEVLKNSYLTTTGGKIFYKEITFKSHPQLKDSISLHEIIFYENENWFTIMNENTFKGKDNTNLRNTLLKRLPTDSVRASKLVESVPIFYRTLIWLDEETEEINCNKASLLIQNKTFIHIKQPLKENFLSQNSGFINCFEKNNMIETFTIKSGLVYEHSIKCNYDNLTSFLNKRIIYSGESIFNKKMILCEPRVELNPNYKNQFKHRLLIRPIKLYEFSHVIKMEPVFSKNRHSFEILRFFTQSKIVYRANQLIKTNKNINLIYESLNDKSSTLFLERAHFSLFNDRLHNQVNVKRSRMFCADYYIPPKLTYKNLKSCLLTQKTQFIDRYTILLFLEAVTSNQTEIVKFKVIPEVIKQIILISNDDCTIVKIKPKDDRELNDFIINSKTITEIGKVILKNKNFLIIQKGQPYFFPNCKAEATNFQKSTNLSYRFLPLQLAQNSKKIKSHRSIYLKQMDSLHTSSTALEFHNTGFTELKKFSFSKFFIKNNGNLYSCLIPRFLKQFTIKKSTSKTKFPNIFTCQVELLRQKKISRTLCLKNYDRINNKLKLKNSFKFIFIKFLEYPFVKSAKSVGLYSITKNHVLQENNFVFCRNKKFIEKNEIIGFLKIEREIGGDIVQGLPRIEEILEARKKKLFSLKIPLHQQKGLVIQKSGLDFNFNFYKLGLTINEGEKANIHNLLMVYFNYYGAPKSFFFEQKNIIYMNRLVSNFEGSYKSFKKVQTFILKSVQSIYKSQGVDINDKHLEVIIQQMTTRVSITDEGNTPLLKREILDIYHIEHMNKILKKHKKVIAYYAPALFGISKASLNNPSFLSAASFQETIKVLTKAGIEGRKDWLRGLKETIIVGGLIPSGTGFRTYHKS